MFADNLVPHVLRVDGVLVFDPELVARIERVEDAFGVKLVESEQDGEFDTIGGLIAHDMGRVPRRGEHHVRAGLSFVVLHSKGGAVKWFKVSPEVN